MANIDLKSILQKNSVVGAGGAGFPSFAKLADGATILVINAVECEPLMYTDLTLMHEKLPDIVLGMKSVMDYAKIPTGLLCVKDYRALKLGLADGQELAPGVFVKHVPNVYPMGDEINLIYTATGRLVQPGQLPITQGVIVYNSETVYNIGLAVRDDQPVVEKWLTIGGNVPEVLCVRVPVGMRVSELFATMKVTVPERHVVIDGGPSMGAIINPASAVITKTTKALLILPDTIPAATGKLRTVEENLRIASSVCCQCTRCTDMCPRHLLGFPIEPHKMVRATLSTAQADPSLILNASLCCSCDICGTFACCQGISPMQVIKEFKAILGKNKMRFVADPNNPSVPNPDREYRMLNAAKWKEMLGVAKYDRYPTYVPTPVTASRVEIRMAQHIGAPSVPCVAVGDTVERGQLIANPGAGLSVPQYASISGKVIFADAKTIIIEA